MRTCPVDLGERSYPIHIGPDLIGHAELYAPHIRGRRVLVVTNETVAPLYLETVRQALAHWQVGTVVLPDGEEYKTLDVLNQIFDALLQGHFDRTCTLVALGGGVIGDMTGFAAAVYQRGVDFIQLPTTLLAQVDSSVGGKTGVNHPLGKNMIGAFHQPRLVLADTATLNTLDDRQFASGLAEVIKYGLIGDRDFLAWLEEHIPALLARDPAALTEAIDCSCRHKARIVAADEREAGNRALLNLGHTFGHAIETGMGYGEWLHGEAVAAGMGMAVDLSRRLGWLSHRDQQRVNQLLQEAGLPHRPPPALSPEQFLALMAVDKKVLDGQLRLVLLRSLGDGLVTADYSPEALNQTLRQSP